MKTQENFYTYIHRKASDGAVFYVGKGCRKRAWDFNRRNPKWKSVAAKHGVMVEICATWTTEKESLQHEVFLISCMRGLGFNLANLADGGNGPTGYRFTEDQRKAMSIARKGKKASEETKRKMSLSQKGRPGVAWTEEMKIAASIARSGRPGRVKSEEELKKLSANNGSRRQEVRDKISKSLTGKVASEESKRKRSVATKGVPKTPEHKEKIRIARLAYFAEQRMMYGKAKSISDEHKAALRAGYNRYFGVENANN